jgi:hypothetical protein
MGIGNAWTPLAWYKNLIIDVPDKKIKNERKTNIPGHGATTLNILTIG